MMDYRKITNEKAKDEIKQFCVGLKGKSPFEVTIPELVNALNIPEKQVKGILEEIEGVDDV